MVTAKNKSIKKKADISKDRMALALEVSKTVEIVSVRLISSNFSSSPSVLDGLSQVDIDVNIRCHKKEDGTILVFPIFKLESKRKKKGKSKESIEIIIEAEFMLTYKVKDLKELSDEGILAFAKTNGIFNAWPYWREYVQSTIARLGIPNYTVPVFRLGAEEGPKKSKPKKRISKKAVPVETH